MNTATETIAKRITLPWPPMDLSPNARVHWSKKSKAAKAYRKACWALVKESGITAPKNGPISLDIEFIPPDCRPRDLDNMLSSIKSGIDGIADAIGSDDLRFIFKIRKSTQIGGMVKVNLEFRS